ncbi:glycerophosphodiester phosphodiesterase [Sphingobium sufflavum]|uniref:glycerophosphodiester phosphodiesterase family protein n=1 Tax=Sphingobium sufflavum TaxID=1129547 RepID=UPI001F24FCA3|nr:glycerophosphodiester phosphodiesterase family protein [Sphingobium sufflavum]MCE7796217.1 glycerophosphodiester phosphodiesterase [Sphingobium sufflavum]
MRAGPVSRRSLLRAGAGLAVAGATANMGTGAAVFAAPAPAPTPITPPRRALLIAHRGCSALRPEHTFAAYAKAIEDGADFIEPDLVVTRDGVLVARHENNIADTTDVAARPEFAGRRTVKTIDGERQEGWFTEDFTFAELKTLRAKERLGAMRPESRRHDGAFQIVSLEEIADFTAAEASARGRTIGLIPEIKHGGYFASIGLPQEGRLLDLIGRSAWLRRAPLIIQSFETANLRALRPRIAAFGNIQLMQLIGDPSRPPADVAAAGGTRTYGAMIATGLADIASYADYLAPPTRMVIPLGPDGRLGRPTGLVEAAHRAGLRVGVWTFRPENHFLAADFRDDKGDAARNPAGSVAEMRRYLATGLDAIFTDDPALGRQALAGG